MFCLDAKTINKQKKCKFIFVYLFIILCFTVLLLAVKASGTSYRVELRVLGLLGWGVLIAFFCCYKCITKKFVTVASIFVLSMFAFSYGQFLLYGFGVKYEYFFDNAFYSGVYGGNDKTLVIATAYSLLCLSIFCVGILLSVRLGDRERKVIRHVVSPAVMKKFFLVLLVFSFIPTFIYNVYLAVYSLANGYSESLELVQPAIIRYLGVFFTPSVIGALVFCKKNKQLSVFIVICAVLNCCISFVVGGRSLAIGLLIGIVIVSALDKNLSRCGAVVICLGGILLLAVSNGIADARASSSRSLVDAIIYNLINRNVIVQFLGEAGFSGMASVWTVNLVNGGYETFNGVTYLGAVLNLLPSSLDFFNLLQPFAGYVQLESWLTELYSVDFGVGFSLIAESYLNFKWLGIVAIFFESILFGRLMSIDNESSEWRRYVSIVMLTVLFTIPRRDIVYLANQITLCIIVPYLLMFALQVFHLGRYSRRGFVNGKF